MLYCVIDFEFNQYFDFQTENGPEPEPACPSEIIQIGAVLTDDEFNVKERLITPIRPRIYKRLHPYVQRMTGLTMSELRKAPDFTEVYEDFFSFAIGRRAVFCTWGGDDIKELYKNILYYDLDYNRLPRRYLNVQKLYGAYRKQTAAGNEGEEIDPVQLSQQVGLKTAIEAAGLTIKRPFHNALSDAEYTADLLRYLMNDKEMKGFAQIQSINIRELKESIIGKINEVNIKLLFIHTEHLLQRKLTEQEKTAVLEIYKLGRAGRFDVPRIRY
ncbi:MAG: exonuclease domain-containing protein [Clostridiales bacterium]|jgi:inhibitor of KinA sporulation pathway (predicted exonuclease)|nr:exonuclease domain-containing protein [Clostridiales bacterium]